VVYLAEFSLLHIEDRFLQIKSHDLATA